MNARNVIFFVFFIVIFVVVPVFVIWPSVRTIQQTASAIYSEYEQLEAKHRRGHQMKFVAAEFRELEPATKQFDVVSLGDGDELKFITSLETLALDNNVKQTLRLKTEEVAVQGRRYQRLPFDLTIEGSYQDTLKHIAALESLPSITQITSIRITTDTKEDGLTQARIGAFVLQTQPQ